MINENIGDVGSCLKVWFVQRLDLFNNVSSELGEEFNR